MDTQNIEAKLKLKNENNNSIVDNVKTLKSPKKKKHNNSIVDEETTLKSSKKKFEFNNEHTKINTPKKKKRISLEIDEEKISKSPKNKIELNNNEDKKLKSSKKKKVDVNLKCRKEIFHIKSPEVINQEDFKNGLCDDDFPSTDEEFELDNKSNDSNTVVINIEY